MAARRVGSRRPCRPAGRRQITARVFIDTTYEGDLMAAAGVSHTLTREGRDQYGESLAGIAYTPQYRPRKPHEQPGPSGRTSSGQGVWNRDFPLDPYVIKGDPASGLLHLLATDPRVPVKVRNDMQRFGLPRDEFPDTGGWPHQLYIREGRRMIGELVMTQHHTFGKQVAADPVSLGSYGTDCHEIRRIVKAGVVTREGKLADLR